MTGASAMPRRFVLLRLAIGAALLGGPALLASTRAAEPQSAASDRNNDMSSSTSFPRQYEAIYHDDKALEHAGVLSMTADGKLGIVSADDRFAEMLATVVRNMNSMPHETIRVPPEPDAPRYALQSQIVPRGSAQFIPTMLANIRRSYRLELRTAP